MYIVYWKNKKDLTVGEGTTVKNEEEAKSICEEGNTMFPNMEHWYEKQTD